jgi:hypothetical protein
VNAGARRVRRVRLAAPHPELVRRGAVLLEDALHTASIPGGSGGRLVLVRRLDVGRIHPHAPPSTLALAIEARLREVELSAVHADDAAAPTASAVWFRDAAEAYALLAVRLAAGRAADAWFWPSAVPGWRSGMAADDGIRLAMRAAAESAQGAAAVAEVLRLAAERGAADRIISAILTTYTAAVLRSLGWTAAVSVDGDAAEPVPPAWRGLLRRWIGTWGADDVRSAWLAATVLIAERPARAADRTLPTRAAGLIRAVNLTTLSAKLDRRMDPAPDPLRIPPRKSIDPPAAAVDRRPDAVADKVAESAAATESVSVGVNHPQSSSTETTYADSARPRHPERPDADADETHPRRVRDDVVAAAVERPERVREADRADDHHRPGLDALADAVEPVRRDEGRVEDAQPELRVEAARTARRRMENGAAEPTEAGGLFFLVNAMERLGMAETLHRHPALLEADLPGRVLLRIAERTRVPADDPAVEALAAARDAGETEARYPFESPAVWARLAREGEAVERMEAGRTLRLDASGRLLLALRPADTDTFALSHSRTFALPADDLRLITEGWVTALRRWCRRYARMGLHDVVRRRGRLAFTRTHVDVTLPLRGVDVRARAVGLDLDPGWVPWLGRVVAFHYND